MVEKKMKCMVMYQYATCILCIVKDEVISEISFGIHYIFKRKHVSQNLFFFNLVKLKVRLFTNKQEFQQYCI